MPFDSLPQEGPRHGLALLAALKQRLEQEPPPRFTWNFMIEYEPHSCGTIGCALGLAWETLPEFRAMVKLRPIGMLGYKFNTAQVAEAFGLGIDATLCLFWADSNEYGGTDGRSSDHGFRLRFDVSPAIVAEHIGRELKRLGYREEVIPARVL